MDKCKKRNYGIDLLRIVSMFMVVVLHVLGQGGILNITLGLTLKGEIAWFIEIACYCAVNCYALISGYVAYNSERKLRTFISLWLQVFFYCFIFNAIELVLMYQQGTIASLSISQLLKTILRMFLPILTNQYWYFTAYAGLFLIIPLLNVVIEHTPRKTLRDVLIILSLLIYAGERLFSAFALGFRDGYSFPWLALVYVIGGYIAKYNPFEKISCGKAFFYYGLCVIATFVARIVVELTIYLIKGQVVKGGYESLIIAYTTPTILLSAMFLVHGFSNMKIGGKFSKVISFFAPLSFGVYLIHTSPFIFAKLTNKFIAFIDYNFIVMLGLVLTTSLAIFAICIAIDFIRKLLFSLCHAKQFSAWMEKNFKKLYSKFANKTYDVKETQDLIVESEKE